MPNALTNIRLEKWHTEATMGVVFAWLVAEPTEKRTPDEIYGVRIDLAIDEIKDMPTGRLLHYIQSKLNVGLTQLEFYRTDPPPLNAHLRREESDSIQ